MGHTWEQKFSNIIACARFQDKKKSTINENLQRLARPGKACPMQHLQNDQPILWYAADLAWHSNSIHTLKRSLMS